MASAEVSYEKQLRKVIAAHKEVGIAARKMAKGLTKSQEVVRELGNAITPLILNNTKLRDSFLKQSQAAIKTISSAKKHIKSKVEQKQVIRQVINELVKNIKVEDQLIKRNQKLIATTKKHKQSVINLANKLKEQNIQIQKGSRGLGEFSKWHKLSTKAIQGDANAMKALNRETTRLIAGKRKATQQTKRNTTAVRQNSQSQIGLANNLRNTSAMASTFSMSIAGARANLLLASFALRATLQPIIRLGTALVTTSAQFEVYKIHLENVLQSSTKAESRFEKFKEVAATTPFNLAEVMEAGITLERFGENSEDLIKTMADLAVFMNMSIPEATGAFGRAMSGGVAAARIFRNRGLFALIKDFNKIDKLPSDLGDFKDIMISTFQDTSAGIAGVTDKMSNTITTAWANMEDDMAVSMAAIGDDLKGLSFLIIDVGNSFVGTENAMRGSLLALGAAAIVGAGVAISMSAIATTIATVIAAMTATFLVVQTMIKLILNWKDGSKDLNNELTKTDTIIAQAMSRGKEWEEEQERLAKLEEKRIEVQQKLQEAIDKNYDKLVKEVKLLEAKNVFEKEAINLGRDLTESENGLIAMRERHIDTIERQKTAQQRLMDFQERYIDINHKLQLAQFQLSKLEMFGTSTAAQKRAEIYNNLYEDRVNILNTINSLFEEQGMLLSPGTSIFSMETGVKGTTEAMADFAKELLNTNNALNDINIEDLLEAFDDFTLVDTFGMTADAASFLRMQIGELFDSILTLADTESQIKAFFDAFDAVNASKTLDDFIIQYRDLIGAVKQAQSLTQNKAIQDILVGVVSQVGIDNVKAGSSEIKILIGLIEDYLRLTDDRPDSSNIFGMADNSTELLSATLETGKSLIGSYYSYQMSAIDEARNKEIANAKATITNEKQLRRKLSSINDKFDAQEQAKRKDMKGMMLTEAYASTALALIKVWSEGKSSPGVRMLQSVALAGVLAANVKKIEAQAFKTGGDFVTSGPEMIMVGDNPGGKERVQVTPMSSPNTNGPQGGQAINIVFTGNVMTDEWVMSIAIPAIKEAVRRGEDIGTVQDHSHNASQYGMGDVNRRGF